MLDALTCILAHQVSPQSSKTPGDCVCSEQRLTNDVLCSTKCEFRMKLSLLCKTDSFYRIAQCQTIPRLCCDPRFFLQKSRSGAMFATGNGLCPCINLRDVRSGAIPPKSVEQRDSRSGSRSSDWNYSVLWWCSFHIPWYCRTEIRELFY